MPQGWLNRVAVHYRSHAINVMIDAVWLMMEWSSSYCTISMADMTLKLSEIREKALADPDVRAEYEALREEFKVAQLSILRRRISDFRR
jgi:hypothetical protein